MPWAGYHMEPTIIPDADQHTGPKRVLSLDLRRGFDSGSGVEVSIDGRAYPVDWGRSLFEIPADRPVSIGVAQTVSGGSGRAQLVLTPQMPPTLEYRGPANLSQRGDLGQPGHDQEQGPGLPGHNLMLLASLLIAVLGVAALVIN